MSERSFDKVKGRRKFEGLIAFVVSRFVWTTSFVLPCIVPLCIITAACSGTPIHNDSYLLSASTHPCILSLFYTHIISCSLFWSFHASYLPCMPIIINITFSYLPCMPTIYDFIFLSPLYADYPYALRITFWWVMVHMHWCLCLMSYCLIYWWSCLDGLLPCTFMILFGCATIHMYWGLYFDESLSISIGVSCHILLVVPLCDSTFELFWRANMGYFDDKILAPGFP